MATTPEERGQKAAIGMETIGAAAGAAGAITGAVTAGLITASAAVNAVPIAGQVASAALAVAGALTMLFAGKGKAGKKRKRRDQAAQFLQQQRENLQSQQPTQLPQPQQVATAQAPPTQGMGQFQEMQQGGQPPIYSSADPVAQPRTF